MSGDTCPLREARTEQGAQGAGGRIAQAEARHAELLSRRDRCRQELMRQRALTLQAVERIAGVLVLPHPAREAPEVKRLRPSLETEALAMQVVMEHERGLDRQVYDVSEKNLGYDVTSLDLQSGELRLIEVKGLGASTGTIQLTPNERRVAVRGPARLPWHQVTKVAHYFLSVNEVKQRMEVREGSPPYGGRP